MNFMEHVPVGSFRTIADVWNASRRGKVTLSPAEGVDPVTHAGLIYRTQGWVHVFDDDGVSSFPEHRMLEIELD
jgi:hypothetical protein